MKRKKRKDSKVLKRILVADDSPTIRKIVELCLADYGIEVVGVGSGDEAIEMFLSSPPALVLADAVMPGPDGYLLCEKIRSGAIGLPCPVVLLADVYQPLDLGRAASCGAVGHIAKPFEAKTLQLMVSDQLGLELVPTPARTPLPALSTFHRSASPAAGGPLPPFPLPVRPTTDPGGTNMSHADLDALAQRVVRMLAPDVVREVAWEVVPEMSELLIRERMKDREASPELHELKTTRS